MNKSLLILSMLVFIFACKEEVKEPEKKVVMVNSAEGAVSKTKEIDSLITANPNSAALYYSRSRIYFEQNNFPKALIDILTSLSLNNKVPAYYLLAGDIYLAMGQGQDAIDLISEAINNNPNNEDLYTRAVEYNFYMKNEIAAMNFANDLLRINRNNADAYFFKGLILKATEKNKAISNFQTCVEQDPTYYNAYMQLAQLYSEKNDPVAIKYYDNALRIDPSSREALYGKGYFYQQQKQYNSAKEEYIKMVIADRHDFQAFYNLGHCFLAQDSLEKAEKHFKMAMNVKPDYVDAIFMLGQIAERNNQITDAKIHYRNALRMLPNNEIILEALRELE